MAKRAIVVFGVLTILLSSVPTRARGQLQPLPRPGNLEDVLMCAGTNEVFWTTAIKRDPHSPSAHEAKRKAGWYSAVALWIWKVPTARVLEFIEAARESAPATVAEIAVKCEAAPNNWRE